ncbi:MAG: hypothetical protein Q9205_000878 [Flavoplaca limonia]
MPKNHHPTTRGGDSIKRPRISTAYSHEFGIDMDSQDIAMGNGHEVKDPNEGSARYRFQLRRLQNEAIAYISNPNQTTEEALDTAQEKLVKMIKSVRQQKPTSSKAIPSNEIAIKNLFIRLAFKQDTYATNDLASLRDLPRLRNTLNIQGTKKFPLITSLDYTKAAHLEIVATHLVGTAADKACSYYSKGEGFFRECIAVPDKGKLTFLGGACTNYAIACYTPYSLAEL